MSDRPQSFEGSRRIANALVKIGVFVINKDGEYTLSDTETAERCLLRLIYAELRRKYPETIGQPVQKVFFDDVVAGLVESGFLEEMRTTVRFTEKGRAKVLENWFCGEITHPSMTENWLRDLLRDLR